ncbi:cAMP-dependent protein kinase inhibitor alpha [Grus japonensis]|uniref:cAMP-dependent protein kinase inhibitor alpha n=1 Tax=Grus japonensis TaxID=30415 RepID=A0ABC9VZG3_GRUJA
METIRWTPSAHINSLEEETVCALIQFGDNIKLRWTVNTLQDRAAIQSGLDKPDEWENSNLTKVSEDKLPLVWTNRLHFYGPGTATLGSSSSRKDLGTLVINGPNRSQQGPLAVMKADSILGCINRSIDQGK